MKRFILAVVCMVWAMGTAAWAGEMLSEEEYDVFDFIEMQARVLEVAGDCTWVVVGETRFYVGSAVYDGNRVRTTCLDASGNPLKNACLIKPRDRVYAKGVILEDRTIMAVTIRKRDP
ncbi:hypothetical protein [Desulfoluna butyratoxydans]|uniref:Uncharacterized protein n=1 Tax=Desulfoluna butyratoxydans TaxID=231438 RepID=A0A4U8YVN9_9BACT|nr:hypothetical protein [Desulfoluna butyratoxydans]VFQ45473.1 hypothetical protein MSL71_31300 [Desulfoluna butyratoxydans]